MDDMNESHKCPCVTCGTLPMIYIKGYGYLCDNCLTIIMDKMFKDCPKHHSEIHVGISEVEEYLDPQKTWNWKEGLRA